MATSVKVFSGAESALNLSTDTVIKTGAGRVCRVSVLTAGSSTGGIHDCATTGAAAAANKIFDVPNTRGVYEIDFPVKTGLVYIVGTGQTVSISYN